MFHHDFKVKDYCKVKYSLAAMTIAVLPNHPSYRQKIQYYNHFSYSSTLGRQSSFRDESSRVGRTRARDSSIDCTTRTRYPIPIDINGQRSIKTLLHGCHILGIDMYETQHDIDIEKKLK